MVHFARAVYPWLVSFDLLVCGALFVRYLMGGSEGVSGALLHAAGIESPQDAAGVLVNYLMGFALLMTVTVVLFAIAELNRFGGVPRPSSLSPGAKSS